MSASVQDKVIKIIAEQLLLEPGDVPLTATLESLGIDSLGLVESIVAIEEEFDIQVPFNANDPSATNFDISSVQSIVLGVQKLLEDQK